MKRIALILIALFVSTNMVVLSFAEDAKKDVTTPVSANTEIKKSDDSKKSDTTTKKVKKHKGKKKAAKPA